MKNIFKYFLVFVLLSFISCNLKPKSSNFDNDTYKDLMNSLNMIPISGGSFLMGEGSNAVNVELSDYYICDHEVTQSEYSAIIGSNPSNNKGDTNPVDSVSWYNALVYCNKKSIASNLTPCYKIDGKTAPDEWGAVPTSSNDTWNAVVCDFNANGFRLPTEAEWEYAGRGGNKSKGYLCAGAVSTWPTEITNEFLAVLDSISWYVNNSSSTTHPVKQKLPNELRLYDMSGNVVEWCWDWYGTLTDNVTDPTGPATGSNRVNRGGSFTQLNALNMAGLPLLKTTNRSLTTQALPSKTGDGLGFRVVRSCHQ